MVSALPSGLSEASYSSLPLQASLILKAEIATVAAGKPSLRAFGRAIHESENLFCSFIILETKSSFLLTLFLFTLAAFSHISQACLYQVLSDYQIGAWPILD